MNASWFFNMEEKISKKAYDEALKDIEEEKKEKIKEIIKATLRKKNEIEEEISKLQKKKKILSKDLEDFKKGRLDLIEERQKVDKLARETSLVRVEKIKAEEVNRPWYQIYQIILREPPISNAYSTYTTTWAASSSGSNLTVNASGSDFHLYTVGTYDIGGNIINL